MILPPLVFPGLGNASPPGKYSRKKVYSIGPREVHHPLFERDQKKIVRHKIKNFDIKKRNWDLYLEPWVLCYKAFTSLSGAKTFCRMTLSKTTLSGATLKKKNAK